MEQQHQQGPCSFIPGGSAACGAGVPSQPTMRLSITSTTGSEAELSVPRGETVEGLKTCLSQKLRLPTDRIVLLHKDRQLNAGRLLDLGVADESKLTLVPTVEAGLATTRTDRTMTRALENLTEAQISDFLSGRSPLTISLGIGAHVMYVQLQLANQNAVGPQQHKDPSSAKLQAGLSEAFNMTHPRPASTCSPTNTAASPPPPPSHSLSPGLHSAPPLLPSTQRPRLSSDSTTPNTCLSNKVPVICHHHHSSPRSSCPAHSTHPLPHIVPAPGSPLHTSPHRRCAPVPSPSPSTSGLGPRSPATASTYPEITGHDFSAAKLCQQPGAVIESFVNHSPGVFSGTFSGTLAPLSQSGISHQRHGITIILQILNDLLRATCQHQGAPPTLPQMHCSALSTPGSPVLPTKEPSRENSQTLVMQTTESLIRRDTGMEGYHEQSFAEENQTLRWKVEQLQFLMHQRRLRRRARSSTNPTQTSHPYQHRHHRPWSPGRQSHRHSSGTLSINKGTSQDNVKMQVTEETPWKPELTSDLVVA
ncbi:midnolin [Myripristis murdjan]|uniref:Midnolin-like n=1 Tax=Myripristis murdjan TaxID=586833 RepID=A0A667WIG1_9TELE|nr:midnolin-like [Myripristis murdjan]